jgi:hypothetical protein
MGPVSPWEWYVFRDDLERQGVLVDSSPAQDANGADTQEKPTAEVASAPTTANVRPAESRDEKMWLHAAVYALALLRAKKTGNDRFPGEHGSSEPVAKSIAKHASVEPATFVRALRTGRAILEGNARPEESDTRALTAGQSTLKQGMTFLAAEVYENESLEGKATNILDLLGGAPLCALPSVNTLVDALKE